MDFSFKANKDVVLGKSKKDTLEKRLLTRPCDHCCWVPQLKAVVAKEWLLLLVAVDEKVAATTSRVQQKVFLTVIE
jgi:hypothetical protein